MTTDFDPDILPDVAHYPGSFLLEEIEARDISPDELAAMMGRPAVDVYEVVNEQAMISEDFARVLERVLGASAQGWLNLCMLYDLILENGGSPRRIFLRLSTRFRARSHLARLRHAHSLLHHTRAKLDPSYPRLPRV